MAKQAIVIIDECSVMPVGLPMRGFLAFDVKPFKLEIPAGWFDCTHLWSNQVYNLTRHKRYPPVDQRGDQQASDATPQVDMQRPRQAN